MKSTLIVLSSADVPGPDEVGEHLLHFTARGGGHQGTQHRLVGCIDVALVVLVISGAMNSGRTERGESLSSHFLISRQFHVMSYMYM